MKKEHKLALFENGVPIRAFESYRKKASVRERTLQ
jgi:hypothetical protein